MNILNRVTRKTLLKNRTRTVVTIIGVILSAAMITAITTFISSMQDFMIRSITASEGGWQASVRSIPYSKAAAIARGRQRRLSGHPAPPRIRPPRRVRQP